MNDIVIDTNVLLHTNNEENNYWQSANETLNLILRRDIYICVDDVFNIDESKNTSVIGHEYLTHIRHGTYAYYFLMDRLINEKITQIFKKDHINIKRELSRMIKKGEIKNRHDITFVIVAYGSQDKTLISNDYDDFNKENRKYISRKFQVSVLDSDEYKTTD
jgi:predicted nucleic acid-binding protein